MAAPRKPAAPKATAAKTAAAKPEPKQEPVEKPTPEAVVEGSTTLDTDVTKPSVTAPGDGPADTTDPTEVAVAVPPAPGPEAIAAGTVNAVVPVEPPAKAAVDEGEHRIEEYEATRPDGSKVQVRHNIDTGETSVS